MESDRLAKGWNYSDLAGEAELSVATITRFFRGEYQTPKAAKRIAMALGHQLDRYLDSAIEAVR